MTSTRDQDEVLAYARDVESGRVVAGPGVRASCGRFIRDLDEAPARGWKWDYDRASRVFRFFREILCLNGGDWEGEPYELLPWQKYIVGNLFGWVNATTGQRRFTVAYIETGKGSGKSPLIAGVGLFGMLADGEPRAEIYAAATKKDQAMVLFRDAVAMVDQSPRLSKSLKKSGTGVSVWNLYHSKSKSFFRPISADDGQSGPRPHIVLLDEIHEHKNGYVIEMLRAGTKGRRQAMVLMITNSGVDRTSIAYDYHDYGIKVSQGSIVDDSHFSYVCSLDEEDDPFKDPTCWIKANPSLGITIKNDYLESQVREARGMPSKESIVRRLNFCQWTEADTPWISKDLWFSAYQEYDLDDIERKRPCFIGLDLSSTTDLTAMVVAFEATKADPVVRLWPMFWLPNDELQEKVRKDRVPYDVWRNHGHLFTTAGSAIDRMGAVIEVGKIMSRFRVKGLVYDRWRIEDFKNDLDSEGIYPTLIPHGQGYKDMSLAVEEFERALLEKSVVHPGNPVLNWNAANVVLTTDPAGNRKPAKDKAVGRIDGIIASIMAVRYAAYKDSRATMGMLLL